MADADQRQAIPCGEVGAPFASASEAVSQLFREHLMSSSCGAREMPTAVTAGDLAFLKALYYRNIGFGPSIPGIQGNMLRQFKGG